MILRSRSIPVLAAFVIVAQANAQAGAGGAQSARGEQRPPPRQLLVASEMTLLRSVAELEARVMRQPCVAPAAPRGAVAGDRPDTIRISTESGYPCSMVTAPTGIELRSSDDGSRPDPQWTSVALDGRGRYFTAARRAAVALSYNANGSFNAVVGRGGRGPGEFANTPLLYVGRGDTLYAFQGNRASIFTPQLAFVRDVALPGLRASRELVHVAEDGRLIFGGGTPSRGSGPPSRIYVVAADGTVERGIGPRAGRGDPMADRRPVQSSIAYSGGNTFWTALASPQRDGYILEEWSLSGELRRVIHRTASWARSDAGDAAVIPGGFPYVRGLSLTPEGYIWALMLVKDPRAGPLAGARLTDDTESQFFDLRYEAIDPNSGRVLVSGYMNELPGENEALLPPLPFLLPRTHLTYKSVVDDATGLERIEIYEVRLVRK